MDTRLTNYHPMSTRLTTWKQAAERKDQGRIAGMSSRTGSVLRNHWTWRREKILRESGEKGGWKGK